MKDGGPLVKAARRGDQPARQHEIMRVIRSECKGLECCALAEASYLASCRITHGLRASMCPTVCAPS